jgi:hypothetical protein
MQLNSVSDAWIHCNIHSTHLGENGENYWRFEESAAFIFDVAYGECERFKGYCSNEMCLAM